MHANSARWHIASTLQVILELQFVNKIAGFMPGNLRKIHNCLRLAGNQPHPDGGFPHHADAAQYQLHRPHYRH
jgi:hypothetical protein